MARDKTLDPLAERCLDLIDEEIKHAESEIIDGAIAKLKTGPMDSDFSTQQWQRIEALRWVKKRIENRVKKNDLRVARE